MENRVRLRMLLTEILHESGDIVIKKEKTPIHTIRVETLTDDFYKQFNLEFPKPNPGKGKLEKAYGHAVSLLNWSVYYTLHPDPDLNPQLYWKCAERISKLIPVSG